MLKYYFHILIQQIFIGISFKLSWFIQDMHVSIITDGINDDENESSAVGGIGLDTDGDHEKSTFQPFGASKKKINAGDRSLIDYFARLGKSKDPNEVIDLNFVDTLVQNGANINCTDKHGQTLLHEVSALW